MTEDAKTGWLRDPLELGSATGATKLCRVGRLLVALSTVAVGLGCIFEPWLAGWPGPALAIFSFHALTGAALIVAGVGIVAGRRVRAWALPVGAALLAATIAGGVFPYRDVAATRDGLARVALTGAMLMLASAERGGAGRVSRWFRAGRWIFAAGALACVAAQALMSVWLQSGVDMFYFNYDDVTLFNSIWSWSYWLGLTLGVLAMAGAAGICFRKTARAGAFCLAAASFLFLPLMFLYRVDDFCGGGRALVELAYEWVLDLGLAGGALIVAAAFEQARREDGAEMRAAAGALGNPGRTKWVRVGLAFGAVVLLALIVGHGLIPFFFFEANSRGNAKMGDLATRLYAATYVKDRGNSYWVEKLSEGIAGAGPAGRACAAGDAEGCRNFGRFYFDLGWNWGRSWQFSAKAAALSASRCNGGNMGACFDLGEQYDQGSGVAADPAKAAAIYQEACDAQVAGGCQKLADDAWYGIGIPMDKHKGATLMKKGCTLGSQWACQRLDFMRHDDPDWRPEYDQ
ncbi:MAG: hypothetical protein ACLQG3_01450 [Terracidiphilus sp.]